MPSPPRVALYARVSTSDQSLDPQLDALRKYAAARGWDAREFLDHGQSGRSDQREGLKALLESARRREVDAVAVVKLDRLGRSLLHLLGVLGELESLDVAFVSLDDGIDTQTAAGRLFMQIRGAFAEYEAGLIRERTLAGLEAARRRGKKLGRPPVMDATQVARARRMKAAGRSVRYIADVLEISRATVHRAVRDQR
jgi:DNA invertase Pin-like site-specific DNA recombinase